MKKIFPVLVALGFLSCKKEVSLSNNSNQPQEIQQASTTEESNAQRGVLTFNEWV